MRKIRFLDLVVVLACAGAGSARAQDAAKQEPPRAREGAVTNSRERQERPSGEHHFWDREGRWWFTGVGAARTVDYFSTLNMRRRGRQEIFLTDDVVDNHPAFAAIEAAATATSIGASGLFHRFGHHKLERWTSVVHIGLGTTGALRNYCLKTAHPRTTP